MLYCCIPYGYMYVYEYVCIFSLFFCVSFFSMFVFLARVFVVVVIVIAVLLEGEIKAAAAGR